MYTRNEVSKLKQEFWTAFGGYMKPVPSAEGTPVNWKNYKTGIRHIYFRMSAERDRACIGIEIRHPDPGIGELLFEQLISFRKLLEIQLEESWTWRPSNEEETANTGHKVEKCLLGVNVLNKDDWPEIISFLKPRIIALDAFWAQAQYGFEGLA
ncbi:DUF4268 domain-containing protein [Cyclobacterium jeungdonense]|uniref:DUF4268 domain-containing protein n=1 Tax=Cyclobacterium jeungdonense TaxID=708087 RepID=A0ABT8C482_9BACT|nr:DUF4268 domain-containing protein [Cyclobacterium jeungdonense]MDN3686849.1 DUF4268 domain-containing protein [Cyclobacterium jeungdonense]